MISSFLLQFIFLFLTVAAQVAVGGSFVDENGNEQVIETTDSHPFWVVTDNPDLSRAASEVVTENGTVLYHENLGVTANGYWVEAKDLREGDVFVGANGELSVLIAQERVTFADGVKIYNFTVDGNHNYFVIAQTAEYGQTSILVHNAKYTADQQALQQIVREVSNNGRTPLTVSQANTILDFAKEVRYPGVRALFNDVNGKHWIGPHIHIPGATGQHAVRIMLGVNPRKMGG